MATRSTSSNRSRSSTGGYSTNYENESPRDEMGGGTQGGSPRKGVRVKAEMANPKVARIIIEIDWQQLASKVARKVGRRIKARQARSPDRTRRSGSTRRASSR